VNTRALGYAPLVPFAAMATLGLVVDRYLAVPVQSILVVAGAGLVVWLVALRRNDLLALAGLWVFFGSLAGAYHHAWRNDFPAADLGSAASVEPRLVRVRGSLDEEPSVHRHPKNDPLISHPRTESTVTTLKVTQLEVEGLWTPASGLVRVNVEGSLPTLHVGDEVEVTGWLSRPSGPMNPGEWDYPSRLLDDRIRSELRVPHSPDTVVRLEAGSWGVSRSLMAVRGWGQRGIDERLDPAEGNVASALLLGDNAAMSADEWQRYVRTGVIHVLAISGQHLVVLGAFLWFVLRLLGIRRRPAAIIVAIVLLGYALMTGGRPSALRAAVMACAVCGAVLLRARALPANTFALSWLVVIAANPTDLFTAGFQLSYLCVAVLIWGIPVWFPPRERMGIEQLVHESRPWLERFVRGLVRDIGRAYLITLVLGLATAPLVAYWQNLVSPAGILIGPPAILFTTIALVAGLLLILTAPLGPVAVPFAWVTKQSLALCEVVVSAAERAPGGCWYVGSIPTWWVVGFYSIGAVWLLAGVPDQARIVPKLRRRWLVPATLGGWLLIGLIASLYRPNSDELRITFVAVDHGGCAVIETPDGRVLLYDAGTTSGPDVTRRQIAPFLWSRGIRRIDEVFLSHADLDHFNGLPALLERFAVGQITLTPSFAEKPTGGVRATLDELAKRRIPVRIARTGDRFSAGEVEMDVLHPPANGPSGVENVRSLVLLIRHRGHSILLTGDLEGAGLDALIARPVRPIDVLMTPHHGSGANRAGDLADWARPRLAVALQGRRDGAKSEAIYRHKSIPYWGTWPDGAIIVRSHATGITAESFVTGKREVVRAGDGP
jgi:competence protein ComEC